MQKLMILGAGVMQAPLIKKAHKLGYFTLLVGNKGSFPGLQYIIKNSKAAIKIAVSTGDHE